MWKLPHFTPFIGRISIHRAKYVFGTVKLEYIHQQDQMTNIIIDHFLVCDHEGRYCHQAYTQKRGRAL